MLIKNKENDKQENRFFSIMHWKMHTKILAIVLAVLILSVASIATINFVNTSNSNIQLTGETLVMQGNQTVDKVGEVITGSIKALKALAVSPSLVEYVEAANQKYIGRSTGELEAEIAALDKSWKDKKPEIEALIANVERNEVSTHLKSFKQAFPEQVEIFVTDIKGLNIAMTDRTSDYLQADEEWWKSSFNNGQGAR